MPARMKEPEAGVSPGGRGEVCSRGRLSPYPSLRTDAQSRLWTGRWTPGCREPLGGDNKGNGGRGCRVTDQGEADEESVLSSIMLRSSP